MRVRELSVRLLLAVPLLVGALAFGSVRPTAAAFSCTGNVYDQTIKTNLVVPAGGSCYLENVVVRGGVTVGTGAELATLSTDIRGSVSGSGFVTVHDGTEVRGNVAISGAQFSADIAGSTVSGSVTFSDFGPRANAYVAFVDSADIRANLICSNVPAGIFGVASASVGGQVILTNCPDLGGV